MPVAGQDYMRWHVAKKTELYRNSTKHGNQLPKNQKRLPHKLQKKIHKNIMTIKADKSNNVTFLSHTHSLSLFTDPSFCHMFIFPSYRPITNIYFMFIIFVFVFVFSLTFHGSSGTTPDLDIDIVNCYTYVYANVVYMLK